MMKENNSAHRSRARRFSMRVPLRYRGTGNWEWQAGETENISCSGVLFRCPEPLQDRARVEVILELPAELSGGIALDLLCAGYVVRGAKTTLPASRATVAVAFKDFRLLPRTGEKAPPDRARPHAETPSALVQTTHKLNNQLAVILGTCDLLLQRSGLDPELRQALQQIRTSTDRIGSLVRQLRSEGPGVEPPA